MQKHNLIINHNRRVYLNTHKTYATVFIGGMITAMLASELGDLITQLIINIITK